MKISGYMIFYNEKELVELSVRNMVQFVDELILVDGCSTDGTDEIVDRVAKDYPHTIKLSPYRQEVNRARTLQQRDYTDGFNEIERRNFAISKCSFDYILCKDVDELYHEDTDFHKIIESNKLAYSHVQYEVYDIDTYIKDIEIKGRHLAPRLFKNGNICHQMSGDTSRDKVGIDCRLRYNGNEIPRNRHEAGSYYFWHYKCISKWARSRITVQDKRKAILPRVPAEHADMISILSNL